MELTDLDIGQIVKSKTGRDQGRFLIVIAKINTEYVLIVDGSLRRIDKPKKKKIKHLAKVNAVSNDIREAILNNNKINNAFIRRELSRLGVKS